MLTLTDQLAENAGETTQLAIIDAFKRATWLGRMFWHSAYHRLGWPEVIDEPS